jgi:hypothetical protein
LSFGDIIPQISDRRKIKLYIVLVVSVPLGMVAVTQGRVTLPGD